MADATTNLTKQARRDVSAVYDIAAATQAFDFTLALINSSDQFDPAAPAYCGGVVARANDVDEYDNLAGVAGDKQIRAHTSGVWPLAMDLSNPPTRYGQSLYCVDTQTLSTQAADGPYFGRAMRIDTTSNIVWAEFDSATAAGGGSVTSSTVCTTQSLGVGDTIAINANDDTYQIQSTGGSVTPAAPLPDGLWSGQTVVLVGKSDTDVATIAAGAKIKLENGDPFSLEQYSTLTLRWVASAWVELGRKANG